MKKGEGPANDSAEMRNEKSLSSFLREARESKHISLERMARDTKLNLDYLYAIEEGDYKVIPADTYVKIYLRSIARYLQMDPEQIVLKYENESAPQEPEEPKKATQSLKAISSKQKIKPYGVIAVVLALIILFSFLRTGMRSPKAPEKESAMAKVDSISPSESASVLKEAESVATDTIAGANEAGDDRGSDSLKADLPENNQTLIMTMKCETDSSWVMVFRDYKKPWRLVLRENDIRRFKAKSIFHGIIGRTANVTVTLNNKKIKLPDYQVLRFSLTKDKIERVSLRKWRQIFADYADYFESPQQRSE